MMTEDDSDQEDLDSTTLQMLSQDESLNYAEKANIIPSHFWQATVK